MHKMHKNSIANSKILTTSKIEESLVLEEIKKRYPDSIIQPQYYLTRGRTTVDFYVKTPNGDNIFIEWKGGTEGSHGPGLNRGDQIKDLVWLGTRIEKEVKQYKLKRVKFICWTTGQPKTENQEVWIQDAIEDGLVDEVVVFVPTQIVNQLVFDDG